MIFEVNGKRLVFGMEWRSMLTEVKVHREARTAKSPYLWHTDKGIYFGLLGGDDQKAKLKNPLYSGAIALLHLVADSPNVMLVLESPAGEGYIVCGIHQGRPRDGCDVVVKDETEVASIIKGFHQICAGQYELVGDAMLNGIKPMSIEDIAKAADAHAQLRKTRSALINPAVMLVSGATVVAAGMIGWNEYSLYKAAQLREQTLASAKNTQQVYDEELTLRGKESVLAARDVSSFLPSLRNIEIARGGWNLEQIDCNVQATKQITCSYSYVRSDSPRATYQAFLTATGSRFDSVEFAGDKITAVKDFKEAAFSAASSAIDKRKSEREEIIEFGSVLQSLSSLGKHTTAPFSAFAFPPGANIEELSEPPVLFASWEFNAPLRGIAALDAFPHYATVSRIAVAISKTPAYDMANSFAMVKITGTVFAKPN